MTMLALLVIPLPLLKAEPPLTWQDCLTIAKNKNPDIISSERAFEAGQAQYKGSFNGLFPHLALSHSYSDSSGGGNAGGLWQANATASLDLLDAAQFAGIRAASANLKLAEANVRASSSSILFSLRTTFAQLLYAQQAVLVAERIRTIWNQSAQMTSLRYDSGSESKGNVMRVKAQLFQAEMNLAQIQRDIRVAQQTLGQALGLDDFTHLAATGPLITTDLPEHPAQMEDVAENTPPVQAQKAVLDQAKASLNASQSSLWPALSASYIRSYQGTTEFPSNPGWSFLGLLNLPIFGNGPTASYYSISAAKRNVEKTEEDLRSIRHQTLSNLESGWSGLAQGLDQVKVQQAFLEADRQRKAEADIRYENGLLSFDNWEIIVTDLVNFEQSYLRSKLNAVNAEATWDKANGKGLEP
jgi:outer membrane protein TolC